MSVVAITTTHQAPELAGADEIFKSQRDATPHLIARSQTEVAH